MHPSDEPEVKLLLIKGQAVCSSCPVREPCYSTASEAERHYTVRGGRWPEGISNAKRGRPVKGESLYIPDFPGEPDMCPNGHDKQITGYYIQDRERCWVCRIDRRANYKNKKAEERKAVKDAQAAAWLALDQCDQGHDLGPADDRPSTINGYYCPECRRMRHAAKMRERRAAAKTAA